VRQTTRVDQAAEDLLRLFATKLSSANPENTDVADVTYRADRGVVSLTFHGHEFVLHFSESSLAHQLDDAPEFGPELWGTDVTALEAAPRLMIVHLDESLATRQPQASGLWT
jgi:hypothetical protein